MLILQIIYWKSESSIAGRYHLRIESFQMNGGMIMDELQ